MEMKDVLISIKGMQNLGGNHDEAELITQGKYGCDEDTAHFFYNESELTGLEGTTTDFVVTPAEVILSRSGSVNSQMVFQRGKRHSFMYDTPYGTFTLALNTNRIQSDLGEHGGNLEVEYNLDIENAHLSRNTVIINVREQRRN